MDCLRAMQQAHSTNVIHGDIKTENIMVTSWNWIFITGGCSLFVCCFGVCVRECVRVSVAVSCAVFAGL